MADDVSEECDQKPDKGHKGSTIKLIMKNCSVTIKCQG